MLVGDQRSQVGQQAVHAEVVVEDRCPPSDQPHCLYLCMFCISAFDFGFGFDCLCACVWVCVCVCVYVCVRKRERTRALEGERAREGE